MSTLVVSTWSSKMLTVSIQPFIRSNGLEIVSMRFAILLLSPAMRLRRHLHNAVNGVYDKV